MLDKMITFAMCLNWFCFCVYYKGWSGYSTISGRSRSFTKSMSDNSSAKVECDACENCSKLSSDKSNEKTAAMVSQAEIWQEDKKFTVHSFILYEHFLLVKKRIVYMFKNKSIFFFRSIKL